MINAIISLKNITKINKSKYTVHINFQFNFLKTMAYILSWHFF